MSPEGLVAVHLLQDLQPSKGGLGSPQAYVTPA